MSEIETEIIWLAAILLIGFMYQGWRSSGDNCALNRWFDSDSDSDDWD
jgi:hypothetical protein